MQQKPLNQEIDLLELLAKVFRILKQNWISVILCPLIGVLAGFLFFYLANKNRQSRDRVQSRMMITTELISQREGLFLCEDLDDFETLPGLTTEQQSKILDITYDVQKELITRDKYITTFIITALVTDSKVFPALQNGLVNYLNQSEPVLRNSVEKKSFYNAMLKKLDLESAGITVSKVKGEAALDSLYSIKLFEKKLAYALALKNELSIHVVKGFETITIENPKASRSVLFYIFLGFGMGLVVLVCILFTRFFIVYYRNYEQSQA